MFKRCKTWFKDLLDKMIFHAKLKLMDELWLLCDPVLRDTPHPPSFYYYHTPEEIKQMEEEEMKEIARLRVVVAEMGRRDAEDKLREEIRKMEKEFRKIEAKARKKKKGIFHRFR